MSCEHLSPSVIYICINLLSAERRRQAIMEQATRLGLDVQFITAVSGRDLPPDVPEYDGKGRSKTHHIHLTPNEIACTLSHIKALRAFLASGAEYAVVMEDDAVMADNLAEGVHEIIRHLRGWELAKLYTPDDAGKLYPIGDKGGAGAKLRAVFSKKILYGAVGWLYSRAGAERILAEAIPFRHGADVQIGHIILKKQIPAISVTPRLISTSDPHCINSTIDTAEAPRLGRGGHRSLLQYLRYRFTIWGLAIGKLRMRRLMKRRLRRV